MSALSSISTILIIGATSGIGEAFARRFHSLGKTVIATGRRADRLETLAHGLPGLQTYVMDNNDLASIPKHVEQITQRWPAIDTVWYNSGTQSTYDFKTGSIVGNSNASSNEMQKSISDEVTVNATAPTIFAQCLIPHLLKRHGPAAFMITTSGLGFVPAGPFAVYCAAKAYAHAFCVALRQQLHGTNVNVWELVAPFVGGTELADSIMKEGLPAFLKNLPPPMRLEDFRDQVFEIMEKEPAGEVKEIAVGTAVGRVDAWRNGPGQVMAKMGLKG